MSRLRQRPLDAAILEALRQHCESVKDPATWAEALEHHARAAEDADADPIALGRLHFELGNLYRDHLRRLDRAVLHYRSAADCDPAQRPAMAAARGLFAEAGNWDQVTKLLALEAESLPRGGKRAQLLTELADVYRTRLDALPEALEALREAVASNPVELVIRHQLATLLLELADRESEGTKAEQHRTEAADTLAEMAKHVSDDYAFAYAEAALDAAPTHGGALSVIESVAPRIAREDAVATRWVAALQHAPSAPEAREIRLKLARAYELAGQLDDARICLEPIATTNDPEARAMLAGLGASAGHRELSLFEADDPFPDSARSLAEELAALATVEGDATHVAAMPVTDLTSLRHDGTGPASGRAAGTDEPAHDESEILTAPGMPEALRELLDGAASAPRKAEPYAGVPRADDDAEGTGQTQITAPAEAGGAPPQVPESRARKLEDEPTRVADLGAVEEAEASAEQSPLDLGPASAELSELDLVEESTSPPARAEAQASLEDALAELEDDDDAAEVSDDELTREPTAPRAAAASNRTAIPQDVEAPRTAARAERSQPLASLDPVSARISSLPEVSAEPLDPLAALQHDLERRLKFRDRRGAADVAERIISMGVLDPSAIAALEDHYRTTRDFRRMRDLSLRIASEPGVSEDDRVARLREAAMLSESKLGDVEGTAKALAGLLDLRPRDDEAFGKLKRMFLRLGRFDDLARLLAQTAEVLPDPAERAARLRELYVLHRDKRRSPSEAIEVLEELRRVDPGEASDDTALFELYKAMGRFADAAVVLRTRIDAVDEPVERVPLLGELAELFEHKLDDVGAAYEANSELLKIAPRHVESLDRAARIETTLQRYDLLVDTLGKKLEALEGNARLPLLYRIADVTIAELGRPSAAADALSEALTLAPHERELWHKAALAFDDAGRGADFDERLQAAFTQSRDAALRFDIGAILAERRERAEDLPGAIAARESQLGLRRDEAVLRSLVGLLRRADRTSELARRLDDLARMVPADAARDLRLERAALLVERLQNPEAAKNELERILAEVAPDDPAVLSELVELSRRTEDVPRRVRAQERLLHVTRELEPRIELAEDLVDVFERVLADTESALRVLRAWCEFDRSNPRPRIRLLPLLEARGERAELVSTLDALAALAIADDETGEYVQRAARVAMDLGDYDGAWNRLVPRVVDASDNGAEVLLTQLALRAQRGEQLAALYVGLAQRASELGAQKERWTSAARVFDSMVGDPARALEAALRAFAKDLDDSALLGEVERLAEAARADKRLGQVYDSLVRRAPTPGKRAQLLLRHARLLEQRFDDDAQALERAALAFQVDPNEKDTYAESIRLSQRAQNPAERLRLHELRADTARSAEERTDALLAGCAVAVKDLTDRTVATRLLTRAVRSARSDDGLLDRIEAEVSQIRLPGVDAREPPLARALSAAYAEEARGLTDASAVATLYTRAAGVVDREAGDAAAAFAYLALATDSTPENADLLDRLGVLAERAGLRDELAAHLSTLAKNAIDSSTSVESLRRLGALYEGPLADPVRAANTYEEEVKLRPLDKDAHARLRNCLSRAGHFKDLLAAIDRELALEQSAEDRAALLCQSAETWERAFDNRYEARDAYRKALGLVPTDPALIAAVERLSMRASLDDSELLDGDLVVRPEDLRPSLPHELDAGSTTTAAEVVAALIPAEDQAAEPDHEGAADSQAADGAGDGEDAGHSEVAGDTAGAELPDESGDAPRSAWNALAAEADGDAGAVSSRVALDYDEASTGQFVPRLLAQQPAAHGRDDDTGSADEESASAAGSALQPEAHALADAQAEAEAEAEAAHASGEPSAAVADVAANHDELRGDLAHGPAAEPTGAPPAELTSASERAEEAESAGHVALGDIAPASEPAPREVAEALARAEGDPTDDPEAHATSLPSAAADVVPRMDGTAEHAAIDAALAEETVAFALGLSDPAAARAQAEASESVSEPSGEIAIPAAEEGDGSPPADASTGSAEAEIEELDADELDADELDLAGEPTDEPSGAQGDGLDALSGLVGASQAAAVAGGRKVPPPPPRTSGITPSSVSPSAPGAAKTAPPPPPRRVQ